MKLSTRALVLVRQRIVAASVPRLFDDRWSARNVRARADRIDRWLGILGRHVVAESIGSGKFPADFDRVWSRSETLDHDAPASTPSGKTPRCRIHAAGAPAGA
jgi:hypothetical protein